LALRLWFLSSAAPQLLSFPELLIASCRCVAANSGAALSMPQSQLQLFICPIGATRPKSLNAAHVIFLGRSAMEWSLWD